MRGAVATMGEATWKDYIPLGSALIVFLGVLATAIMQRWNTRDTVRVSARVAEIDASKVEISHKQLQAQQEEMVARVTHLVTDAYSKAFADQGTAYDHLQARFTEQGDRLTRIEDVVVPDLRALLAACETRERERAPLDVRRDTRIARLIVEVQRLGGNVDC